MNPHLLYIHNNKIILDKIEGIENINHGENVEYENYYNVNSNYSYDDGN